MSVYAIRALDASTWDAFARLAEKHKGMGFGGCWCTWFRSCEGRPEGEVGRPWKERLVREGKAHAALVFDGDAAVAWCRCGSPEELPRIYHRKEWEAGLTGEPPAYRITCIFVNKDYRRRRRSRGGPWSPRSDSAGGRWRGGGLSARLCRASRCGPSSSIAPRAASSRTSASATSGPRERRIA